jgi:glycosyltransferase involved in cell wall biosynthesis
VVVPTFSRRRYLFEALDSLLAQTFGDYEALVCNDGGPAHIGPVKERFVDRRIRWIDNPVRKGLLGNMLHGFARARGRYLATLHDDDRWAPELLASLVPRLERDPTLTVAFADHFIMDGDGRIDLVHSDHSTAAWGRARLAAGVHRPFRVLALAHGTIPVQCAAVFRRDALDPTAFPREAGTKYDRWLVRELARGDAGAWYEPARLAYYRLHSASQTSTGRLENARAGIYIYEHFLADPELADVPRGPLVAALAADHHGAGTALLRAGQRAGARRHLIRALRLAPRPRTALGVAASFMPSAVTRRL